ncbi:histamine H2 receptor-like [Lytechinus pictus]|uniref:histamine H2 receptor-like n=1 Tax=Lytechinus pictus TaxID=7653 RepID=UPI0030B9E3FD
METLRVAENVTEQEISVYDEYGLFNVYIVSTLFSIIAFLGLTGNAMVFIAVGLSRKLHDITNTFIVNLSICDFLACTILPFHVVSVISGRWPLADWYCSFIASLTIIIHTSGTMTLALISLNRYMLITKPRKLYMKVYTHHNVAWMIAMTWLFPFFFLLMPQFFLGGLGYRQKFRVCIWNSEHKLALIFQGIGALAFILSTVIIIFSYISIFCFVRKHMQKMTHNNSVKDAIDFVDDESSVSNYKNSSIKSHRSTKRRKISKKQLDITKNLCLVVVAFFICVLPYTIHLPTGIYDMRGTYLGVLFVSHTGISPILYAAKHPHFKNIFSCMFRCKYSDIPMPTMGLKKILNLSSQRVNSINDGRLRGPSVSSRTNINIINLK